MELLLCFVSDGFEKKRKKCIAKNLEECIHLDLKTLFIGALKNISVPYVHGSLPQAEGHSKLAGEGTGPECVSRSVVSHKQSILSWRCGVHVQEGVCEQVAND